MRKIIGLDAVRGFAAFMVFTGHFFDGLDPAVSRRAAGTPLAGLLNGTAAVVLFFVLSGFVLTIRPMKRGQIRGLLLLVFKRWPRLAGTVVFASLFYIAIAWIGGFPSQSVLQQLRREAPPYVYWGRTLQDRNVGEVLAEASAGTFLQGSARHIPVLWTMHLELLGSILAAGFGLVVLLPLRPTARGGLFLASMILIGVYDPWLLPFPLGVAGALLHLRLGPRLVMRAPLAITASVACVLIWSWDIRAGAGLWAWTNQIAYQHRLLLWIVAQSCAAFCCIAVALYCPLAQRTLSGRVGAFAGRYSFPLYLMHLLVMLSFSSRASIVLVQTQAPRAFVGLLFVGTLGVTLLAALPIAMFDPWWVRAVDQVIARILALWTWPRPDVRTQAGQCNAVTSPEPHPLHRSHGG